MSHYLRNLTDSPVYNVELTDLGITIEVGADYDTSEVEPNELGNSIDLADAIAAGEVAFLDDTASPWVPLSTQESQAIINASTNTATNVLGTINYFPKWSDDCPCTLTESNMYQDPDTGYIGINLSGSPLTPATGLDIYGALQLTGSSSGYTRFTVPASGDDVVYTLPSNDGDSLQVLQTDGSGTLTWVNQTVGPNCVLDDLSDVVITGSPIGDNEVLAFDSGTGKWINQTLAEAGISASNHTHVVNDLTDVTIAAVGSGEVLVYQGSPAEWQNNTLVEAGISAVGHTHALNDLTDVTLGSPTPQADDVLTYNGSTWEAQPTNGAGICKQIVYGSIDKLSCTTTIPNDNTLPTSSEGTEIWSADITPGATSAVIKVNFSITVDAYQGGGMGGGDMDIIVSVFRNSTNIGGMSTNVSDYDEQQMAINIVDAPNTTSQVTYSARVGKKSGESGTAYVNRLRTERYGGMLEQQGYTLEEIDEG